MGQLPSVLNEFMMEKHNSRGPKKVMIFDDDESIQLIFRFIFESKGWTVYAFPDCDEVEKRVMFFRPDLILMDNWLPGTGGKIAVQLLKKNPGLKDIPVIYVSANADVAGLAKQAGAERFLAKPFDFQKLFGMAEELVGLKEKAQTSSTEQDLPH